MQQYRSYAYEPCDILSLPILYELRGGRMVLKRPSMVMEQEHRFVELSKIQPCQGCCLAHRRQC